MNRLAILGASGHGKVVADSAECAGWKDIVFYDDAWPKCETNGVWQVVGDTKALLNSLSNYDGIVVAIGQNSTRFKIQTELLAHGAKLVNIIHPSAQISQYAELGIGNVVMAGAVINVDTKLGVSCIVNTGAIIDHDCTLGDGVHISPGAHLAGGVTVGNFSWIGLGANIRQLVKVGDEVVVGVGAVVINDIIGQCTVVGVPAKLLNKNHDLYPVKRT